MSTLMVLRKRFGLFRQAGRHGRMRNQRSPSPPPPPNSLYDHPSAPPPPYSSSSTPPHDHKSCDESWLQCK